MKTIVFAALFAGLLPLSSVLGESPVVATIHSHESSYDSADAMVFDFAVSNRTDGPIEIGSTRPDPRESELDFLVFATLDGKVVRLFDAPAWPRDIDAKEERFIIPPHATLEFRNIAITKGRIGDLATLDPGKFKVHWVLKKLGKTKSRQKSNTITVEIK